jgi:hypothetical protein
MVIKRIVFLHPIPEFHDNVHFQNNKKPLSLTERYKFLCVRIEVKAAMLA